LPAISYFAKTLRTDLPDARVVFIANCGIKEEIVSAIEKASELFCVETVVLHNVDKYDGHPTVKGMQQIAEQVIDKLKDK
jgi:hypothetical protein